MWNTPNIIQPFGKEGQFRGCGVYLAVGCRCTVSWDPRASHQNWWGPVSSMSVDLNYKLSITFTISDSRSKIDPRLIFDGNDRNTPCADGIVNSSSSAQILRLYVIVYAIWHYSNWSSREMGRLRWIWDGMSGPDVPTPTPTPISCLCLWPCTRSFFHSDIRIF